MKIAVLFSLVVLVVVASLKAAPAAAKVHCTCVKLVKIYKAKLITSRLEEVKVKGKKCFTAASLKKGPKAACKGVSASCLAEIKTWGSNCGLNDW